MVEAREEEPQKGRVMGGRMGDQSLNEEEKKKFSATVNSSVWNGKEIINVKRYCWDVGRREGLVVYSQME